MGVGETGVGEMRVGEMGIPHLFSGLYPGGLHLRQSREYGP